MDDFSNGFLFAMAVTVIFAAVLIAAMLKVFSKAGRSPILALVPLVNMYVLLRIAQYPRWKSLIKINGFFIPLEIGLFIYFSKDLELHPLIVAGVALISIIEYFAFFEQLLLRLSRLFGKDDSFAFGLFLFPFVYYPILAYGKAEYRSELPTGQELSYLPKIGVVVYGVFALFCLMTSVAIYTQQMGFVLPKGENTKGAATRVDKAIATTKSLQIANNRALTRWVEEADEVVRLEAEQALRREFYRGQIEMVRRPKKDDSGKAEPIIELVRDAATGMLKIDPAPNERKTIKVGRLLKDDAQPQSFYEQGLEVAKMDNDRLQKETREDDKLAEDAGLKINGNAMLKGLRTRIVEQDQIAADADAEALYLEDFITNRRADAQLFVKRRDALQASIDRLVRFYQKKQEPQAN